MGEERSTSMSLPLDSDGFLRRECPTCEREFKWLYSGGAEAHGSEATVPDGGYYCPYCGVQAPPGDWWTPAQLEQARATAASDIVGPMLADFARSIGGRYNDAPERPEPLTEDDDMVRVNFLCHPTEPVKVMEDWSAPVRCLICGQAVGRSGVG